MTSTFHFLPEGDFLMNLDFFDIISCSIAIFAILFSVVYSISGANKFHRIAHEEPHFPWYNYPPILRGIAMFFTFLFYILLVTETHLYNFFLRIVFVILTILCAFIAIGVILHANRHNALMAPKQIKRKDVQPK